MKGKSVMRHFHFSHLAITAALAVAASSARATMEYATPESQGVRSSAISSWLDANEAFFDGGEQGALHGFVIVRHGKVIAEGSWRPYDTLNETHMLYSHSKSFTSTAIGFLLDDGKLDLDERVAEIFADRLPAEAATNANVRALRVRDLLTMNVGSDNDHRLGFGKNVDWPREFFELKCFTRQPGTGFKYDSDATFMLAAIAERRSGRKLMDFLGERLFKPLGITKAWSTVSPEGIACGGWGMNMTTRDLARFGQLYLDRGRWEGRQLLSPEWVQLATARQTWSSAIRIGAADIGKGFDWDQGYGFQFWRCRHGAYRADGAFGQYTVVFPAEDMVVSINASVIDLQKVLDFVYGHLLAGLEPAALPADDAAEAALRKRLASLALAPLKGLAKADGDGTLFGRDIAFKANNRSFKSVRLDRAAKGWTCTLDLPVGRQTFPIGFGEWSRGEIGIDTERYEALGGYIGRHAIVASGAFDADGTFRLTAHFPNDTGTLRLEFKPDGKGGHAVKGFFFAMCGMPLESAQ